MLRIRYSEKFKFVATFAYFVIKFCSYNKKQITIFVATKIKLKKMAKTKPIGVRFDEDLLNEIYEQEKCTTHQGVLTFLENYYKFSKVVNSENNLKLSNSGKKGKLEIIDNVLASKIDLKVATKESYDGKLLDNIKYDEPNQIAQPHPLYKIGDPKEDTMAFVMKYDCNNYEELSALNKKAT